MAHQAGPHHPSGAVPTIHPTAVIGPGVVLGEGVRVGPHAVLTGPLEVGARVWIGSGAVLGAPPEVTGARMNLAWDGDLDHAGVVLEADVVVREHVVVHQGTARPTRVGEGTWLLSRSYVAHDVEVGRGVVVSAGVSIGGHATVGDRANLGLNAAVHQRRVVGVGAMVGMSTAVNRDVPPYGLVHGSPMRLHGVNRYALSAAGLPGDLADLLEAAYRESEDLTTVHARPELAPLLTELARWCRTPGLRPVRLSPAAAAR